MLRILLNKYSKPIERIPKLQMEGSYKHRTLFCSLHIKIADNGGGIVGVGVMGFRDLVETALTYCNMYFYGFSLGNTTKFKKLTYHLPSKLCSALYFTREATREILCQLVSNTSLVICSHVI